MHALRERDSPRAGFRCLITQVRSALVASDRAQSGGGCEWIRAGISHAEPHSAEFISEIESRFYALLSPVGILRLTDGESINLSCKLSPSILQSVIISLSYLHSSWPSIAIATTPIS